MRALCVSGSTVEVLAIVAKSEAGAWLEDDWFEYRLENDPRFAGPGGAEAPPK